MKIGIDFDNTIVCYSDVFHKAALERNLIPPSVFSSKGHVRDYLRKIGKEEDWIELQGYVYGARMALASPFQDVSRFLASCEKNGISVFVISHKTLHPYKGPKYDLHKAAKDWLSNQAFSSIIEEAYFELTLQEKLQRIQSLSCDFFIDDLPELLLEKNFPQSVQKILFDPDDQHKDHTSYNRILSWNQMNDFFETRHAR